MKLSENIWLSSCHPVNCCSERFCSELQTTIKTMKCPHYLPQPWFGISWFNKPNKVKPQLMLLTLIISRSPNNLHGILEPDLPIRVAEDRYRKNCYPKRIGGNLNNDPRPIWFIYLVSCLLSTVYCLGTFPFCGFYVTQKLLMRQTTSKIYRNYTNNHVMFHTNPPRTCSTINKEIM